MAEPFLHVEDLRKSYGGLAALKGVDLTLDAGDFLCLFGPNGAGKSTLFNLVAGDFRPSSGTLELFGQDVTPLPAFQRTRLGISRTYQTSRVLSGLSVLDNLYLAVRGVQSRRFSVRLPRETDACRMRSRALAASVGLATRVDALANELSHGEQRQLEIGMALAGEPRLLLLDEPAAGLSPAERPMLTRMLRELPRDMTMVLIEHDMQVALQVADRVTVMNEGAVVFDGSPQEAAASPLVELLYLGKAGRDHAAANQGA